MAHLTPRSSGQNNSDSALLPYKGGARGEVWRKSTSLIVIFALVTFIITSCLPTTVAPALINTNTPLPQPTLPEITPLPTRPLYTPGQLVDYIAQSGDTLPALAARFNTTEKEIRDANPVIPSDATTMPPGFPMKIPIYYQPFWSSPFEILPDSLFVNGPAQVGFDTVAYVNSQPGWLKDYSFFVGNQTERGGAVIQGIADDYSISPRLLLAVIEYDCKALSDPKLPESDDAYYLGYANPLDRGLYRQLVWFADWINNAYYSARIGTLTLWDRQDGSEERPDPWLNPGSVALQYYFSQTLPVPNYLVAISGQGFAKTYTQLFGDPWLKSEPHIPGSLTQPPLHFPFLAGQTWAFTGGPHTGFGDGEPYAAVDFAPGSSGCEPSNLWATALADGTIVRTGDAEAVLDLDGDGHEQTGWTIYYLHLENTSIIPVGSHVKVGDPIGHPSCEGGHATGTHVHIARKYNGEWIEAGGVLAFNLEGWVMQRGSVAYEGSMTRGDSTIRACTCSDSSTFTTAGK
jgi:LasA protease